MTELSTSAPPKLSVSQTVRASYAIVAGNLGSSHCSGVCGVGLARRGLVGRIRPAGEVPLDASDHCGAVVGLPLLASIAIAWHRLVLRGERVAQPAYLRLDGVVAAIRACQAKADWHPFASA